MSESIERHVSRLADALVVAREARDAADQLQMATECAEANLKKANQHVRVARLEFEALLERTAMP